MAQKVKIAELFDNGQRLARVKQRTTYWQLAYFWGQTALFDDLAPTTWDEIFWAEVNVEQPKMFPKWERGDEDV
jgi:hypothetical protein